MISKMTPCTKSCNILGLTLLALLTPKVLSSQGKTPSPSASPTPSENGGGFEMLNPLKVDIGGDVDKKMVVVYSQLIEENNRLKEDNKILTSTMQVVASCDKTENVSGFTSLDPQNVEVWRFCDRFKAHVDRYVDKKMQMVAARLQPMVTKRIRSKFEDQKKTLMADLTKEYVQKDESHASLITEKNKQHATLIKMQKERFEKELDKLHADKVNYEKQLHEAQKDRTRFQDLLITQRNMFGDFLTDMQTGKWYKKDDFVLELPKWFEAMNSRFGTIKGATIVNVNNEKEEYAIKYYSDKKNKWIHREVRWSALNHAILTSKRIELNEKIELEIHGNRNPQQPTTFVV